MPDEAGDDLLKRIDEQLQAEASQPGPDAMRWAPPPAEPADNASPVTGMLLGVGIGAPVELAPDEDAGNVLLPMIGDPDAHRYCSVAGVTFWTGAHSVAYRHRNGGLNVLATHTLLAFLRAVITGDFSASNREVDRARQALQPLPIVFGSCVVLGQDTDGEVTGLSEPFLQWWTQMMADSTTDVVIVSLQAER